MKNLTMITGGVRSGKSLYAEKLAKESGKKVIYIATMPVLDDDNEQQTRIQRHKTRRPESWTTIEAPYTLPQQITDLVNDSAFCLIDCLSVYVSNLILGDTPDIGPTEPYAQESRLFSEVDAVISAMEKKPDIEFTVVTNEVGWGVVPDNKLSRAYRDFLGLANQTFAQHAANVFITFAGLPMRLK